MQPLYNTIVGVQANFRVSYPIRVIMRVKCNTYIHKAKIVRLGSNSDQCYIQNRVVMNRVIKRSRCIIFDEYFSMFHYLAYMVQ